MGGSFFLFRAEARIGIGTLLLVNIVAIIYHYLILRPGLRIQHQAQQYVGTDYLIGTSGEVTTTIDPVGMVRIQGELWKARADTPLERGQRIRVIAIQGMEVQVQADEPKELKKQR